MYRHEQCTAGTLCRFLSECDEHYDDKTGEWDYPKLRFDGINPDVNSPKIRKGIPSEYPGTPTHTGKYREIVICLKSIQKTHPDAIAFSSKYLARQINDTPRSVGNYLRYILGIKHNRKTHLYSFTGESIEVIR